MTTVDMFTVSLDTGHTTDCLTNNQYKMDVISVPTAHRYQRHKITTIMGKPTLFE